MRRRTWVAGMVGGAMLLGGGWWLVQDRQAEQARAEAHAYTWELMDAIAAERGLEQLCSEVGEAPTLAFNALSAVDPGLSREGYDTWATWTCELGRVADEEAPAVSEDATLDESADEERPGDAELTRRYLDELWRQGAIDVCDVDRAMLWDMADAFVPDGPEARDAWDAWFADRC